jgi:hypothetical protein
VIPNASKALGDNRLANRWIANKSLAPASIAASAKIRIDGKP